jgi:uncharacterized FlgJ-related protein
MSIYTFNDKTLTYSKLPIGKSVFKVAAASMAVVALLSINIVEASEYERILEVRIKGNEFSEERLRSRLDELNVRFADVAMAQAKLETSGFRSRIFRENHNLFGMKEAKTRVNLARGTQYGHAYYKNWEDSVLDYAMWCAAYANHCRNNEQFLELLSGYYAEDPEYISKLRRIMKSNKDEQ